VAIGLDAERIVHANGFHMMVAIEPLDERSAESRRRLRQPTSYRRV
jgi:hypothetical protein